MLNFFDVDSKSWRLQQPVLWGLDVLNCPRADDGARDAVRYIRDEVAFTLVGDGHAVILKPGEIVLPSGCFEFKPLRLRREC